MSTLLVLYPGCVFYEIAAAVSLLSGNQKVIIASPNGQAVVVQEGFEIHATCKYNEVDVSHLKYVLVPGGDCESAMNQPDLNTLLKEVSSLPDCLIGGICNGALVLANAGLLNV